MTQIYTAYVLNCSMEIWCVGHLYTLLQSGQKLPKKRENTSMEIRVGYFCRDGMHGINNNQTKKTLTLNKNVIWTNARSLHKQFCVQSFKLLWNSQKECLTNTNFLLYIKNIYEYMHNLDIFFPLHFDNIPIFIHFGDFLTSIIIIQIQRNCLILVS